MHTYKCFHLVCIEMHTNGFLSMYVKHLNKLRDLEKNNEEFGCSARQIDIVEKRGAWTILNERGSGILEHVHYF